MHVALQVNVYEELKSSGAESKQDYFELVTDEWNGSAFYDITINTSMCRWPQARAFGRRWAGISTFSLDYRRMLRSSISTSSSYRSSYEEGFPASTYYVFKDETYLCTSPMAKRFKNIAVIRDA